MAQNKTSYPMLPAKTWWQLRRKFKQSIPGTVTAGYLAAALNMQEQSARGNVLPYLEDLGIVDDDGKTLDRARQWRDDAQYAEVCKQMREEVYPQELLDAVPNPSMDRDAACRWFANSTGKGQVAVNKMVTVYSLLVAADPTKETAFRTREAGSRESGTSAAKTEKVSQPKALGDGEGGENDQSDKHSNCIASGPGIHINIQVHVSSDATPDQIDQIFASMARHIYCKE